MKSKLHYKGLLVLSLMLFVALKMSGQSNQVSMDSIKNDSLQFEIFEQQFLNSNNLRRLPFQDVNSTSLIFPSSYYLKGHRMFYNGIEANGDYIYIDGMQVSDGVDFPFRSIRSFRFYGNDSPIELGNSAAGFIDIETLDASDKFGFAIEAQNTFRGLNEYKVEVNLNAPIRFSKKKSAKKPSTIFVAGNYFSTNNNDPIWETCYVAESTVLSFLNDEPLRASGLSSGGTLPNAEFVQMKDITSCKNPENAGRDALNAFAKINIPISNNIELTIGNYSKIENRDEFVFDNALFNSKNNPERYTRSFDNYLRFEHEIINSENLKIEYQVFLQYSNYFSRTQSRIFKDKFFEYGYLGKYSTAKIPAYFFDSYVVIGDEVYEDVYVLQSWDFDTAYTFQNLYYNPEAARYTEMIYELFPTNWESFPSGVGNWRNADQLQLRGGLLNGQNPGLVYGLWNNTGNTNNYYGPTRGFGNYTENSKEKIRGNLQFVATYKSHYFTAGFEYCKSIKRNYSINPSDLWTRMRHLTNVHIQSLDFDNPTLVYNNSGIFQDTIMYYRLYQSAQQNEFDKNLRKKLGLPVDGVDYILTDSYDMINNTIEYYDRDGELHTIKLNEDLFALDMFSPEELLNYGLGVSYMGYDYTGKRMNSKSSPYDFFTNWSVDAFRPVYFSGYVEDKFKIKNFSVSVGLRLDVYNANQPVLKDPYLLFPAYTVGESDSEQARLQYPGLELDHHPGNMGDEYVIYVNETGDPSEIAGYRNGSAWFNDYGEEVQGISALGPEAGPLLIDRSQYRASQIDERSFTNYKAVYNLLPQLTIDYTISPNTQVYFNYNSYSQNPDFYNEFRLDLYYYLDNRISVTNPALKPLRVDKFNLGVMQRIYKKLFFDGGVFLNSLKNNYYYDGVYGAYPRDYYTLLNYDTAIFNTGAVISMNYYSAKTSGLNLNVSITKFLFDERSSSYENIKYTNYSETSDLVINAYAGFNFGIGREYIGPVANNWKVLEDFGMGLFFQFRKGTPYYTSVSGEQQLEYTPGFKMFNLKLEKGFYMKNGAGINLYLLIENLFNFKNVFYVYPQTGQPDDDGFLSDPEYQNYIDQQTDPQSYRDLYSIHLKNPNHYGSPRVLKAGFILHL
ncbi:MAG: hypothetical protein R2764_12790 [Bacteroidales bacterium]